ncbi:MAG: hypothetical protein JWP43_2308 [Ramlibacter sp.]|jgi:tripartite-type tricarboxylate transporter receptor subunit TctC|nr:hypothetical protein [Ramlibacter sp.]
MMDPLDVRGPTRRQALRMTAAAVGALAAGAAPRAFAQSEAGRWPERQIRIVVPYPAGGSADTVVRPFAQMLSEKLGQPIVIDNKPGASGNIGTVEVMRAKPDGYTLLLNPSVHVINPELMEKAPYRTVEDFTAISLLARCPLVLMVPAGLPAQNVAQFAQLARARPKEVNFATSVIGSASHLAEEYFNRKAKTDIMVVPFKGSAPANNALIAGDVQAMFDPAVSAVPMVRGGRLRALAVTSRKRLPSAPEIPTMEEAGIRDFEFYTWYGLWAPAGLPPAIAARLEQASREVVGAPEFQNGMASKGLEAVGSSSPEFVKFIHQESQLYRNLIRSANIKPQT